MFRVAQAPLDLTDRFFQVPDALLNFGVDVPRLARHRLCARRGALIVLERFFGALGDMVSSFRAARSQHVSVKPESTLVVMVRRSRLMRSLWRSRTPPPRLIRQSVPFGESCAPVPHR
jgi:hypothetical protein